MLSQLKNQYLFAAFLLLLPSAAFATDIYVDGSCIQGTCPPPTGTSDAIQYGDSVPLTSGSADLTIGTDTYLLSWAYSASYTADGTAIFVDPAVTYTGASPSTSDDTITFSLYQSYYDDSPGTWDGAYTEDILLNLSGDVGSGSTAEAQLFYDGQGLGLVGPFGPGSNFGTNTVNLTGLDNDNLVAEFDFTYNFQAGTLTGAGIDAPASSVPEPAEALPLGLALFGVVCCGAFLRRRSGYTNYRYTGDSRRIG